MLLAFLMGVDIGYATTPLVEAIGTRGATAVARGPRLPYFSENQYWHPKNFLGLLAMALLINRTSLLMTALMLDMQQILVMA